MLMWPFFQHVFNSDLYSILYILFLLLDAVGNLRLYKLSFGFVDFINDGVVECSK